MFCLVLPSSSGIPAGKWDINNSNFMALAVKQSRNTRILAGGGMVGCHLLLLKTGCDPACPSRRWMGWAGGMFLLLPACRGGPVGLGVQRAPPPLGEHPDPTNRAGGTGHSSKADYCLSVQHPQSNLGWIPLVSQTWGLSGHFWVHLSHP